MKQVLINDSDRNEGEFKFWSNENMDKIVVGTSNYMAPIFDELLIYNNVKTILDLGCGNGFFTKYFKKNNVRIVGVDGSVYGLKQAISSGFDECWHIEDFNSDPIELTEKFDLIVCKDVMEHLLFPDQFLKNATKLLSPNGRLLVQVPNHFTLYHRLKFLITSNIDTQLYFTDAKEWNYPHIRFFTDDGMRDLFNSLNLKVEKSYSKNFSFTFPFVSFFLRKLKLDQYLAQKWPNQFSIAFTYSLKLKN